MIFPFLLSIGYCFSLAYTARNQLGIFAAYDLVHGCTVVSDLRLFGEYKHFQTETPALLYCRVENLQNSPLPIVPDVFDDSLISSLALSLLGARESEVLSIFY